jgi:hypothetical protein
METQSLVYQVYVKMDLVNAFDCTAHNSLVLERLGDERYYPNLMSLVVDEVES